MDKVLDRALALQKETVEHRRYLHQNAEVGFDIPKTTAYIEQTLKGYGVQTKRLKKGGVIAEIFAKDGGRGDFILLRADVDGLTMREESGLPYACKQGNMHACGHDMHAAALLSAAKLLKESPPSRPVRLLFQPAEEILKGGEYALRQGVCDQVKAAFSLHVLSGVDIPVGTLVLSPQGVVAPSADTFEIVLEGKSCHGAMPHQGIDALSAASAIVQVLQHLTAYEIPAGDGLVTVGLVRSGEGANILAGKAVLQGSCRALSEELRALIKKRIREVVKGVAAAYKVRASLRFYGGCPSLVQDEKLLKKGKDSV